MEADEAVGLHLIGTLVDRATASRLRESKLKGYTRLGPERIVLSFQVGKRRFLGDNIIYAWSRPTSEAPPSVRCALLALALWMKHQIESGRPPEELFSSVLSTSKSIAIVAVCVSAFFAYPEKCFRAALPFVTHPFIWDCDREIRSYIAPYIFSPDKDLSDNVTAKIRKFRDKILAAHGNRSNYRFADDGRLWFIPPAKLVEPHRPFLQHLIKNTRHIELMNWVHGVAERNQNLERFTIIQAIERAKELQQPDDFSSPLSRPAEDYERMERLGAIVGAVTAALRLDLPQVIELGQLPWCEGVLIAAAQTPCDEKAGWRIVHSDDFVLTAAHGLTLLLEQDRASERPRQAFFDLLQRPEVEITDFVFSKIPTLWDLEPVFCRNAVARELALSVEPWREKEAPEGRWGTRTPKADAKVKEIKDLYACNIREIRLPASIGFGTLSSESRFETRYAERALRNLPIERLSSESDLPWVLEATERALSWTLSQLRFQNHDHPSRSWLRFLGDWLARLSRHVQSSEVERLILRPFQEGWPGTARLVEEVLVGWTEHRLVPADQLSEESKAFWRALAETILTSTEQPRSSTRDRLLELLLHVRNGRAYLTEHWQSASEFLDLYEHWIEIIGPTPWGLSRLIVFLSAAGKRLEVDRVVQWVSSVVASSNDRDDLWREHDNLSRTAEWLGDLWGRAEEQIRKEPAIHADYASLLDELVRAGSPLAERLRRQASGPPSL